MQYNVFAFILQPGVYIGLRLYFEIFDSIDFLRIFTLSHSTVFLSFLYLSTFGVLFKAGKMFSKPMHLNHVVRINNITVPHGWTSHFASIFQNIETAYFFELALEDVIKSC